SMFFFSSRRRHTRSKRDWSSDVCSSDLILPKDVVFNEHLQSSANAALAIRVLGEALKVTWLVGSADDTYGATGTAEDFSLTWLRSEERRVGKERTARWARGQCKKTEELV